MSRLRDEIRSRVERLLSGDGSPADLQRIFLALRAQNFGRQSFLDVGDAVAHTDRRDRGLATRRVRELHAVQQIVVPNVFRAAGAPPLDASADAVRRALRAQLNIIPSEQLREATGLTPQIAASVIGKVVKHIHGMKGGDVLVDKDFTERERNLVSYFLSTLAAIPAYSDVELIDDFCHVLTRNGCVKAEEIQVLRTYQRALSAFAIVHMHGARVEVDERTEMEISANLLGEEHNLSIGGAFPHPMNATIKINLPIFQSSYRPSELFCAKALGQGIKLDRPWELDGNFLIAEI